MVKFYKMSEETFSKDPRKKISSDRRKNFPLDMHGMSRANQIYNHLHGSDTNFLWRSEDDDTTKRKKSFEAIELVHRQRLKTALDKVDKDALLEDYKLLNQVFPINRRANP